MAKNLNIAALRARAALAAPTITAPDGREFAVSALSLDAYLGILDLEEQFDALRAKEQAEHIPDRATQKALFGALVKMVGTLIPGFPAGELQMDELFQVLGFAQAANTPAAESVKEAGAGAEAGESGK